MAKRAKDDAKRRFELAARRVVELGEVLTTAERVHIQRLIIQEDVDLYVASTYSRLMYASALSIAHDAFEDYVSACDRFDFVWTSMFNQLG